MAKLVGPLHSSEARGSVGALTYNTWRGISIVKARAGPSTQYSDAQVALRALTALATTSWQGLTDAERHLWHLYAGDHTDVDWTGNDQRLSGYNWYVRINVRRQLLAEAIGTAPPTYILDCGFSALTMAFIINRIDLTWELYNYPAPGSWYFELYATPPLSAGRHPTLKQCLRIGHVAGTNLVYHWMVTDSGTYTAFCRVMHESGIVSGWRRMSAVIP